MLLQPCVDWWCRLHWPMLVAYSCLPPARKCSLRTSSELPPPPPPLPPAPINKDHRQDGHRHGKKAVSQTKQASFWQMLEANISLQQMLEASCAAAFGIRRMGRCIGVLLHREDTLCRHRLAECMECLECMEWRRFSQHLKMIMNLGDNIVKEAKTLKP